MHDCLSRLWYVRRYNSRRVDRPLHLMFWQRLLSSGARTADGDSADWYGCAEGEEGLTGKVGLGGVEGQAVIGKVGVGSERGSHEKCWRAAEGMWIPTLPSSGGH